MVRKVREIRKMGGIIPAPQGFVCEFLIRVSYVAGNCSEPYLQSTSRNQLTADLQKVVLLIEGIVIDDLKGFDLRRTLEESLNLWKHSAILLPLPANGRGTALQPATPLNHPQPAIPVVVCSNGLMQESSRIPDKVQSPALQTLPRTSGRKIENARLAPDID